MSDWPVWRYPYPVMRRAGGFQRFFCAVCDREIWNYINAPWTVWQCEHGPEGARTMNVPTVVQVGGLVS